MFFLISDANWRGRRAYFPLFHQKSNGNDFTGGLSLDESDGGVCVQRSVKFFPEIPNFPAPRASKFGLKNSQHPIKNL